MCVHLQVEKIVTEIQHREVVTEVQVEKIGLQIVNVTQMLTLSLTHHTPHETPAACVCVCVYVYE